MPRSEDPRVYDHLAVRVVSEADLSMTENEVPSFIVAWRGVRVAFEEFGWGEIEGEVFWALAETGG